MPLPSAAEGLTPEKLLHMHIGEALDFAVRLARGWRRIDPDDAMTAALTALERAAYRYDEDLGSFWNYVKRRICGAIDDYIRKHNGVSVPFDDWHDTGISTDMETRLAMRSMVNRLDPTAAMILVMTEVYEEPSTAVAAACKLSRSRISQRRTTAKKKLRRLGANDNKRLMPAAVVRPQVVPPVVPCNDQARVEERAMGDSPMLAAAVLPQLVPPVAPCNDQARVEERAMDAASIAELYANETQAAPAVVRQKSRAISSCSLAVRRRLCRQ